MPSLKTKSITLLVVAETLGMCLWFSSAAVIADMGAEREISNVRQALLSSGVQFGFAVGAIVYAVFGLADRYDPRRVFALSAVAAALFNAGLLIAPIGSNLAILLRIGTGALLAGVYPVGMKIAVGWGTRDRGLLVGLLVGALTLGSAAPHLLSFMGGTDWRLAVAGASLLAFVGGLTVLFTALGPNHVQASAFSFRGLHIAWTDKRIRLAYAGYLGHMWELYALWAWIAVALTASFTLQMAEPAAVSWAKLVAFCAVGAGAVSCVIAGIWADRIGKAEVTVIAMAGSGLAALAAIPAFGGSAYLMTAIVILWGIFVIADSAQFSALVADYAPPEQAGALLTLQTALGFGLTVLTVQIAPVIADLWGWPFLFAALALGPFAGIWAMWRLMALTRPGASGLGH